MLEAAIEIALRTGRTVYDSQYVALAVQIGCRLVTADEKLYNALKDGPLGTNILWVEDDIGIPEVHSMPIDGCNRTMELDTWEWNTSVLTEHHVDEGWSETDRTNR